MPQGFQANAPKQFRRRTLAQVQVVLLCLMLVGPFTACGVTKSINRYYFPKEPPQTPSQGAKQGWSGQQTQVVN